MLKKISFFLLTVTPFFGLISCSSIYKFYEFIPKNENKSLLKNQRIQEFVDSIFAQNEGQKQDYIINQINKNGLKISQELKYSLIFSKPYFRSINDEYLTTRENANYTIHSYLAKNWLFLLENIEKLSFIFNPYQTRFLKNPQELEVEKIKDKTIKISNKNFDFIKINSGQNQFEINNVYYLIFDKNKFIRFTVFGSKSELKTKLDYNMFYLDEEIPDKFLFINSLENWINEKEKKYFQNKLKTASENLEDEFQEQKSLIQQEIKPENTDENLEDEEEDEAGYCSLENPEKCSKEQLEFLQSLQKKPTFHKVGQINSNISLNLVKNSEKLEKDADQTRLENEKAKEKLKELEIEYQNQLENLETKVEQEILNEKKDLEKSNFFTNITSDISDFNSPFKFYKYSLYSIDLEKSLEEEKKLNKNTTPKSTYLDKYNSFVDKKLEIKKNNEKIEEFSTRRVYEYIFNAIWKNNDKERISFLNNYHSKQNIEKLEKDWKLINQKMASINRNEKDFDLIIHEYKNFVSQNWLFILERLDKISLTFHKWYTFPDQFNEVTGKKVSHSPEFKEFVRNQEPLFEPFFYANKFLESIAEGDTSLILTTFKDLYILKQNTLINLKVDISSKIPKVTLNPFVFYFPKTKNKISIKILTEIFHQALYHQSQESYNDFEKDFVEKFRYNLPAQMIISEKFS
ncbi:aromatic motif membrane protein [Mesomycoplasma hyopneumoniae]|uniref:aromatic motif membrane protein n=1 Tax=Mesomycoplasma hyopneumoniae TaxID=2099 RepID=UPI0038578F33